MEFETTRSLEITYLSEVFLTEDSEGKLYVVKRNRGRLSEVQIEFIHWLISERPEGFLVPLEIREAAGNCLEEVYDFIDLPTLDKVFGRLEKPEGWTFSHALGIARQLTASLGIMHDQGFIHHDVRAGNLFMDPQSFEVKLFDYNSVRKPYYLGTGIQSWNDTPPEYQLGNTQIDFSFDVYQAGMLLVRMTHNYDFGSKKMVLCVETPEAALEIMRKACHGQREERFANCKEFHNALSVIP